jgi:hypothetical protein
LHERLKRGLTTEEFMKWWRDYRRTGEWLGIEEDIQLSRMFAWIVLMKMSPLSLDARDAREWLLKAGFWGDEEEDWWKRRYSAALRGEGSCARAPRREPR